MSDWLKRHADNYATLRTPYTGSSSFKERMQVVSTAYQAGHTNAMRNVIRILRLNKYNGGDTMADYIVERFDIKESS